MPDEKGGDGIASGGGGRDGTAAGGGNEDSFARLKSGGSDNSAFSDHKSQDGGNGAAERREEEVEVGNKKKGFFGGFGFGKKEKAASNEDGEVKNSQQAAGEDEDEMADTPDSEDEEEDGSTAGGKKLAVAAKDGRGSSNESDGSQTEGEEELPKKKGFMAMFGFGQRMKRIQSEHDGKGTAGPSKDKGGLSPRSAPVQTKTAVQKAVQKSLFVKLGRMTRVVFWRDASMQSGKEGSVDFSKIVAANPYSMRGLQQRVHTMQLRVCILAMVGLLSGVMVNEWCWLGYIPTAEEEMGFCSRAGSIETPLDCSKAGGKWTDGFSSPLLREGGQRCRNPDEPQTYLIGLSLKIFISAVTGILLFSIFHLYECIAIELCFRNHLEYHREFVDVPFWNLGLLPEFLLEFLVCFVHPGPRLHFNLTVEARGRLSIYNSESILVAWMFMRLYTLWRYYREWMFMRYTSKNFASRLSDVSMDSKLAIKAILADVPFQTISFLFLLMTFTLAYLVRIAEAPANMEHIYFWNQLWLIVVTATSTGYGDLYPLTHLGRFVCTLAMIAGIVLTAVLITTVSTNLELNAGEHRLMNFLQSEHWEREIKVAASRSIQSWWRRAIFHPKTLQALRNFKAKKKAYRKFLEATPHFSSFVESMKQDTEMVRQTLSKIEGKVVSGLDLGKLDRGPRGAGGLGGLSSFGGGGGSGGGGGGGNPVPGKVFEELMIELAQIRKANAQLKTMIDKGSITTSSILTNSQHGGAMTPGQQGGMTLGRTSSAAGVAQTFQRVPSSSARGGVGANSYRGRGGNDSAQNTARSGQSNQYGGQDPAIIASKAVEERVRRLEIQVNNFDKGMAKCLSQIVRLLQGLY